MKTEQEIKSAIKQCLKAMKKDDPKLCPVWPKNESLYCVDCTCRYAMRWILTGDPEDKE
jgi:hypothetical protein